MEQLIEIMINIIKKSSLPFIVSTMLLTIIGSFIGKDMSTISTLCTPQGIPFASLFQLMGLSIIIGIINTIFDLSNTLKKIRLIYQIIIRVFLIITIIVIFVSLFDWFPFYDIHAWIGFFISFSLCFGISMLLSLYFTHKKDQEYEQLLEKYKERRQ